MSENVLSQKEGEIANDGDQDDEETIEIVGAVKLMDGLFLGDAICAEDFEFLKCNKITYVVNCAGDQIENMFENKKIKYLTMNWQEFKPIDLTLELTSLIINFVEDAYKDFQGVLIHSINGKNRCCVAALVVFMLRYRWGLIKTLEFLNAKKPGLEMTASLLKRLLAFEQRLESEQNSILSKDWSTFYEQGDFYAEEQLIVNSYKNSQKSEVVPYQPSVTSQKVQRIRWADSVKIDGAQAKNNNNTSNNDNKQYLEQFTKVNLMTVPSQEASNDKNTNQKTIPEETLKVKEQQNIQKSQVQNVNKKVEIQHKEQVVTKQRVQSPDQQINQDLEIVHAAQHVAINNDKVHTNENSNTGSNNQRYHHTQSPLEEFKNQLHKYEPPKPFKVNIEEEDNEFSREDATPSPKNLEVTKDKRGPYNNPLRTSHENALRLSISMRDQEKIKGDSSNEQRLPLSEIKKHSYMKKGVKQQMNETAMYRTNDDPNGQRYNPMKVLLKESRSQQMKNQQQTNTEPITSFYQINNDAKEQVNQYNEQSQEKLLPEQMTSRDNIYSNISSKVDNMKYQVKEMKQSYLESVKEQSETRRSKFYTQSIAHIFGEKQNKKQLNSVQQQQQVEQESTKSDLSSAQSTHQQSQFLPLLPKAKELTQRPSPQYSSMPDNLLLQQEKVMQQQTMRMQTRLHFLQQREQAQQVYYSQQQKNASLTSHLNQQMHHLRYMSPQQQNNNNNNSYNNDSSSGGGKMYDIYSNRNAMNVNNHFAHYTENNTTIDNGSIYKNYLLEEQRQAAYVLQGNNLSSDILVLDPIKYKLKPANKLEQTTRHVIANSSEKRRIL